MEVMEVIKYCGTSNRNGENRNKKKKNQFRGKENEFIMETLQFNHEFEFDIEA